MKLLECQDPLGMESGAILDAQVTASSEYSNHQAYKGRLNHGPAWAASSNNANEWLQIDLGGQYHTITRVTRVATQGTSSSYDEWVKAYKLQFSDSGASFEYYKEQGQTSAKVKFTQSQLKRPRCILTK